MIELDHVTKRYGDTVAVDDVTFTVQPGVVTGFLGPNGAGKSTAMRLMLGLDAPDNGSVRVNGRRYRDLEAPLHEIGATLEAQAIHSGRSAHSHLRALAMTHGLPVRRVDEVIDLVGLGSVSHKRVGGFSLGMGQRLGVASALIGDPRTVILDEPVNGLDPDGIKWIRTLLRRLAAEGRTVFLSSHLMSEMALTAERLVILGRGRVLADTTVKDVVAQASADAAVHVRVPEPARAHDLLTAHGAQVTQGEDGMLVVHGIAATHIGELAAQQRLVLYELTPQTVSLEEAYMRLTGDSVVYRTTQEEAA
jgi:ABC-2 type transport system ATP-binding protein